MTQVDPMLDSNNKRPGNKADPIDNNNNNTLHATAITATITLSGCDNILKTNNSNNTDKDPANNAMIIRPTILPEIPENPAVTALLAPFLDDLMQELESTTAMTNKKEKVFLAIKTGEKYTETKALGEGVFKVADRLGDLFVVKAPKETVSVDMIKKETQMLEKLRGHRNVIQYFGVVHDSSGMYLRQELCLPRDLASLMAKRRFLKEPEVCYFANHLVAGLRAIHRSGIIHRDLNPANVLVGEGMVLKISNFGSAIHKSEKVTGLVGSVGFVAPEVVKREEHTTGMDLFSLGIILYMMFNCKKPRITDEYGVYPPPGKFYRKIRGSKDAREFIKMALKINPKERALIMDLALHNFLQKESCPKTLSKSVFDTAPNTDDNKTDNTENTEKIEITDSKKRKAGDDRDKTQGQEEVPTKGSDQTQVREQEGLNKRRKLDDFTPHEKLLWDAKDLKARKRELKEWWLATQVRIEAEEDRLKAKYGPSFCLDISPDSMELSL